MVAERGPRRGWAREKFAEMSAARIDGTGGAAETGTPEEEQSGWAPYGEVYGRKGTGSDLVRF